MSQPFLLAQAAPKLNVAALTRMKSQLEALVEQMYDGGILYREAVREFKRTFLVTVLRHHKGNQSKAARTLGVHRNTLARMLEELGMRTEKQRGRRAPQRVSLVERAKTAARS
jgi:DNA-binding protein Fis